jgi:hypothetical protein
MPSLRCRGRTSLVWFPPSPRCCAYVLLSFSYEVRNVFDSDFASQKLDDAKVRARVPRSAVQDDRSAFDSVNLARGFS